MSHLEIVGVENASLEVLDPLERGHERHGEMAGAVHDIVEGIALGNLECSGNLEGKVVLTVGMVFNLYR